jgi:hypothetical protein
MPSAVIQFFQYLAEKQELLIGFQSGKQYIYEDVPPVIAHGLKAARSRGEYFNEHIRDRYTFRRRGGDDG